MSDIMKRVASIVGLVLCAGIAMAGGYQPRSYGINNSSEVILPAANVAGKYWVTNTVYAQGTVVIGTNTNGPSWYYWAAVIMSLRPGRDRPDSLRPRICS